MNQTYTVKAGDTLYGISNQFGVSVTELANLNNVKATNLQIGQVLTIPSTSGTNPTSLFTYTVKKGDSLYKIASKYNTTVKEIQNLNNLTTTNLQIGQVLRIPENYSGKEETTIPNYINYTVKKGDTLYSIAKNNNVSVDTIIQDNSLTSNNLSIGQNLKIRITESTIEECYGEDYSPSTTTEYKVVKGDSLYKIASKYNTTVKEIQNLNNLATTNLQIGQILKIPITSTQSTIYTVKSGDNLYSIARKFNTTVDSIKRKNNLTSNLLTIGQSLII